MAAKDILNSELFHGTVNPNWGSAPWVHLGERSAAENRLKAVANPDSFDYEDGEPQLHSVNLRPDARVSPPIPAELDEETGAWRDLGHKMEEGTWKASPDFDVYPYENVDEGGTSYYVNRSAIHRTNRIR